MLEHAYIMRQDARRKLDLALSKGIMTEGQRSKIFDNNFDEFVQKPILLQLEREGHVDLPGVIEIQPRSMRSLPSPYTALKPKPEPESNPEQKADRFALEKLEKEKIASILFPRVEDAPK